MKKADRQFLVRLHEFLSSGVWFLQEFGDEGSIIVCASCAGAAVPNDDDGGHDERCHALELLREVRTRLDLDATWGDEGGAD